MNKRNHYIPKLILRKFAENDKVNTFDVQGQCFKTQKLKNVFCEEGLFSQELEDKFAHRLEGPFGNLLNNKLLAKEKTIEINREENFLIRKFEMVHLLRSVYTNRDFDEMMNQAGESDNPTYLFVKDILNCKDIVPSEKTYFQDLDIAMSCDSLEELYYHHLHELTPSLFMCVERAITSYFAIWDASESGQEFILAKMPGINLQDFCGSLYKSKTMLTFLEENKSKMSAVKRARFDVLFDGIRGNVDNYWIFPLSPTRALVGISPYFKAFFPQPRSIDGTPYIPALLPKAQFQKHFYEKYHLELFEPCVTRDNQNYTFTVKSLTKLEVMLQNALVLNEEIEEFAFHDYNKIRDSFWTYEHVFAMRKKKHDYAQWI